MSSSFGFIFCERRVYGVAFAFLLLTLRSKTFSIDRGLESVAISSSNFRPSPTDGSRLLLFGADQNVSRPFSPAFSCLPCCWSTCELACSPIIAGYFPFLLAGHVACTRCPFAGYLQVVNRRRCLPGLDRCYRSPSCPCRTPPPPSAAFALSSHYRFFDRCCYDTVFRSMNRRLAWLG